MIYIKDIVKTYKRFELNIQNLEFQQNQIIGILGNNGAGKTTLFSLILDLTAVDKGSIKNKNYEVSKTDAWKKHTSAYLDEQFLVEFLTPIEYFQMIGNLRVKSKKQINDYIKRFEFFFGEEFNNIKNKYIRKLSKGNKKKTGILGAFIGEPELVILDEPFTNLDPSSKVRLQKMLQNFNKEGITIIISSHEIDNILEISDRILLIEKGKMVQDQQNSIEIRQIIKSYFEENA